MARGQLARSEQRSGNLRDCRVAATSRPTPRAAARARHFASLVSIGSGREGVLLLFVSSRAAATAAAAGFVLQQASQEIYSNPNRKWIICEGCKSICLIRFGEMEGWDGAGNGGDGKGIGNWFGFGRPFSGYGFGLLEKSDQKRFCHAFLRFPNS